MGEWVIGSIIRDCIRDYYGDPFSHSLLCTRGFKVYEAMMGFTGYVV